MAFPSITFRVLIASPSDLAEERQAVREAILKWNSYHAAHEKVVLLPEMWETHAAPLHGQRPQETINRDLVDHADIVIGMFWTRLGTSTGVAESGTVEEIERAAANGRLVMLYFSNRKIAPSEITTRELDRLHEFKGRTFHNSLCGTFDSPQDASQKVFEHLILRVRALVQEHRSLLGAVQAATGSTSVGYLARPSQQVVDMDEVERVRHEFEERLAAGKFRKVKGDRFLWAITVVPGVRVKQPISFDTGPLRVAGGRLKPILSQHGGSYVPDLRSLTMLDSGGLISGHVAAATEITDRGIIYAARHWLFHRDQDAKPEVIAPFAMDQYEPVVLLTTWRYLKLLRELGVRGPYWVAISALRARNTKLVPTSNYYDFAERLTPYDGDDVRLDPVSVPDNFADADAEAFVSLMRSAIDQFWRAYGFLHPMSIDQKTGKYKHVLDEDYYLY